ncbi:putative nucleic acid-binding protein [Mesorhizobium sp. J18]|uniref:type II toxin-antitoxin system VapC family toxin n=1 Tax=Mesorhizobium sp. J18 TaxID=935263 RepID=UPI001199F3BF|nr:type II toxin-antitoxin system VapC family toxin [Mesorhizobium sp. J18]TWG98091.1 putative nucleic acid-binding protein [Mesorhizobium sp. J18]
METLLIDASIAVKWVVEEEGTDAAVALRSRFRFAAPELLVAECSNILWKKVRRSGLTRDEARLAAQLLERSGIEFLSVRGLMEQATALAIDLGHPAYDCVYLALAHHRRLRFVTADERLLDIVGRNGPAELAKLCVSLEQVDSENH